MSDTISKLKATEQTLTGQSYSCLLIAHAIFGDHASVLRILNECLEQKKEISSKTIVDAMFELAASGASKQAIELLEWLRPTNDTSLLLAKLIFRLAYQKKGEAAFEILKVTATLEKSENALVKITDAQYYAVLNALADQGKVKEVQEMFSEITTKYSVPINIRLLGPLVKCHLAKNNLARAADVLDQISRDYKILPNSRQLLISAIRLNDETTLKRAQNLLRKFHGQANSLTQLALAYVSCGNISKALRLLQSSKYQLKPEKVSSFCELAAQLGQEDVLRNLLVLAKHITEIDRPVIFQHLLQFFTETNASQKAMELLKEMESEGIKPSASFLTELALLLQRNDLQVPFEVPEDADEFLSSSQNQRKEHFDAETSKLLDSFRNGRAGFAQCTEFVRRCTEDKRLTDATKVILEMARENLLPRRNVFDFFLIKAAAVGDVHSMELISHSLDADQKREMRFYDRYCCAFVNAGQAEKYLNILVDAIDKAATREDVQSAGNSFPGGGAFMILKENPELTTRCK